MDEPEDLGDDTAFVPTELLTLYEAREWDRAVAEQAGETFDEAAWEAAVRGDS